MRCVSLILSETGVIVGDVVADDIVVSGRVIGPISGRNIALKATARVNGDIRHGALAVEKGARHNGASRSLTARASANQLRGLDGHAAHASLNDDRTGRLQWLYLFGRSVSQGILSPFSMRLGNSMDRGPPPVPPPFLSQPPKRKPVRRWRFRTASPALSLLTVLSAGILLSGFYWLPAPFAKYPLEQTLAAPTERELVLLDARGKPFARRGGCYDAPVSADKLPRHFIDALLAMEDRRFYRHFGIDPVGVLRAAVFNYNAGKVAQGGSTITQQLAKISYLSGAKTLERKLEEALIVLRLESGLTKDQILERYLSRAYFGEGCFGLRAAARHYFNRPVSRLTVAESAYLVALLKSPTYFARNNEDLRRRERLVLRAMADDGRLDKTRLAAIQPAKTRAQRVPLLGAYYADWIAENVALPDDGNMKALPVRTSFEPQLQKIAEQSMARILRSAARSRRVGQAALVAMRPDGRVVAMVGGVDYRKSQFNRAAHALRQPGSSFKAFVYLAALRAGALPEMHVFDEPITIGDWSPENYSRRYRGLVSLQNAFSSSINTVAVRLSEAVGRTQVVKAARDLGITTPLNPDPSIALGTSEVTLLELTAAYAAFSANAFPVKPWSVVSLGDAKKKRGQPPTDAGRWRLMAGDAMREFLAATVQHGTGRGARLPIPAYGKTGTSQNYRDAWFIGFAGNLVVGVWVGNDDNRPMRRVTGGNLPALIWQRFMSQARRKDRQFKAHLPGRIAAFRAEPRNFTGSIAQASHLESLLLRSDQQFAGGMNSGAYFGGALLFGQPMDEIQTRLPPEPLPRFRRAPGRSRPVRTWVNDQDGS